MRSALISIDDLEDRDIEVILTRAGELSAGPVTGPPKSPPRIVGLLFLEASLRTRVGFSAAVARLGWHAIGVDERRIGPGLVVEAWDDTLRILAGYADVVVARPGHPLAHSVIASLAGVPFVNAGDVGPTAEHPTQALIDVFAIEKAVGPLESLHVAICGDPRMRAARSLLKLFGRRAPARVSLIAPDAYLDTDDPVLARGPIERRTLQDVADVDVLYVVGMPHESLPYAVRAEFVVDETVLGVLRDDAIVLSPLPVIDEIAAPARGDARVRMFWQSDQGLYVRMAVLEELGSSGAQAS